MPRALIDNGRVELRLRPEDKATLTRAASLKRLDLTGYILGAVLPKAEADIAEAGRLTLSERDSLRVLALLENPPAAPERLGARRQGRPHSFHDGHRLGRGADRQLIARIRAARWYESYGALRMEDAPRSLVLPLATAADALKRGTY